MGTRRYDFLVNVSTSDAPTAGDPSATGDTLTLGYADKTYARRRDLGWTAASYAALKALTTTGDNQRYDGQVRLITDTHELWEFRSASSATDDGESVLAPDSGTGRWHILSSDAAGGGSGSANNLELLAFKLEQDILDGKQTKLDNSTGEAFFAAMDFEGVSGSLMENYTSGGSSIAIGWDLQTLNNSSQNIDSITNWSATNAGASLAASNTAGEFKVGTHGLKFDKDNSATTAGIRYDRGSQNFALSAHWRMFFNIKLPSLTNLTNVYIRVYADSTSNYAQWNLLSNYAGTALAADWNFMFVDLSTTPSSTGGTGWTKSSLVRYVEIGVTASSSAQTYTGIIVDGVFFSFGNIKTWGVPGSEFTIFDTSNKNNLVVSSANASGDGMLTLAASLSNSYTGGLGGSSAGRLKRTTLETVSQSLTFDTDLASGTIANQQEARISAMMRESLSGNFQGFIDLFQPEIFEVKAISGNSVSGEDYGNVSANCVSGNVFDVFGALYRDGRGYHIHKGTVTLNANSSHDATRAYVNLPLVSSSIIAAGDFLAKRAVTGQLSVAASGADESFQAEDLIDSPNNIELIDAFVPFPYQQNVQASYRLGGVTQSDAVRNRFGTHSDLTLNGSPVLNGEFFKGRQAVTNISDSNYFSKTQADVYIQRLMVACWFYNSVGFTGTFRTLFNFYEDSNNDIRVIAAASSNELSLLTREAGSPTSTTSIPLKVNGWNFIVFGVQQGVSSFIYCNGVYTSFTAGAIGGGGETYTVGRLGSTTGFDLEPGDRLADMVLWQGAPSLNSAQCDLLYNQGNYRPFNQGKSLRYRYELNSTSGQKLSMKATVNKNTSVFKSPYLQKMGMIKVS
jgi:hypothetical protein